MFCNYGKLQAPLSSPGTFRLSIAFFLPTLTQPHVKLLHILIFFNQTTCLGYRKILLPHMSCGVLYLKSSQVLDWPH